SKAVLVVECPEWSGARITANLAGELGKPIYAVPGQIDRPTSAGCNALIREGATLVTGGHDILDDISVLPLGDGSNSGGNHAIVSKEKPALCGAELGIFDALEGETLRIDELLSATSLPLPEVNATLLKLEIQGLVRQLPGGRFCQK
ncbi:MAG: DNA-processing protein DprA, partial [Verrucomicrobiae bacterium]|nr:DNA-processing protein DprA [Verrucomicrobiae bacterium]NNJ87269.1 DNA-protecting protein DprA [Akkermansiaceae bacterium]